MIIQNSAAVNVPVILVSSSDHVTAVTGASLTITLSKDGAAFASVSPTVTELAEGWYNIALTAAHTDTNGALLLHASASGADPVDLYNQVVAYNPNDSVLGLADLTTIRKLLVNKTITDPSTGVMTVYDDDDSTTLLSGNVYEDAAGVQAYQGEGAERRDRLT